MKVKKTSGIDWLDAMSNLSIGAFFLLNILYRYDIDVSDCSLMEISGVGLSTHRKHKRELVDEGYLLISQVGRGIYLYSIGKYDGR